MQSRNAIDSGSLRRTNPAAVAMSRQRTLRSSLSLSLLPQMRRQQLRFARDFKKEQKEKRVE
ncbi:uncharacterized protein G2W53_016373 [Senna tora]|uniref:Uncharacterized protein n=1 Tax=Senna tora TaxID=362788 RepID=A0A834TVW7_9FABA|nr:uncharacterized protein G2W53_016373 [Senna tora]